MLQTDIRPRFCIKKYKSKRKNCNDKSIILQKRNELILIYKHIIHNTLIHIEFNGVLRSLKINVSLNFNVAVEIRKKSMFWKKK